MRQVAYAVLFSLLILSFIIYFNLNYFEVRLEHPHAKFCSNGVIFDNNTANKVIEYSNNYIEKFVGKSYFNSHIFYVGYSFRDCNVVLNYKYVVGTYSKDLFVRVYIPNQNLFVVKDTNAPQHPFEVTYPPSSFHVNYTSYTVNYDPQSGFTYTFYYDNIPIGTGNAQTGEFQRTFNTL